MDKWPDVFSDLLDNLRTNMLSEVKTENPQSHLYHDPTIPEPEVKS